MKASNAQFSKVLTVYSEINSLMGKGKLGLQAMLLVSVGGVSQFVVPTKEAKGKEPIKGK